MFAHWFKTIALVAALAAGADASIPLGKMLEESKSKMREEFLFRNSVTVSSPEIPTERGLRDLKKEKKGKKEKKSAKKGKKGKSAKIETNEESEDQPESLYLENNVVEVLSSIPETTDFSILLGLFDSFEEDSGFQSTFFAPSNEALREWNIPMDEIREIVEGVIGDRPITDFYNSDLEFSEEDQNFFNNQYGKIILIVNNHEIINRTVFAKDITDGLEVIGGQGVPFQFQIENDAVTVNGVNIVDTDIEAANGVIHIVDGVMVATEGEFLPSKPEECLLCNILIDPNFEILLTLVNQLFVDDWCQNNADICVAAISGRDLTLFPPVNSGLEAVTGPDPVAFAQAVGPENLNTLMRNHLVEGIVTSSDLADGQELTSLADLPLQISLGEQGAFVNGQPILAKDFFTFEGVYHPIGGVLLTPPPPPPPQ